MRAGIGAHYGNQVGRMAGSVARRSSKTGANAEEPTHDPGVKNAKERWGQVRTALAVGVLTTDNALAKALRHRVTEGILSVLIFADVASALQFSIHTQPDTVHWTWILRCFTSLVFTVELVLRLIAEGRNFTVNVVNLVDLGAVTACWLAVAWPQTFPGGGCLRLFRVLWVLSERAGFYMIQRVSVCAFYNPKFAGMLSLYGLAMASTFATAGVVLYSHSLASRCVYEGVESVPQLWCSSKDFKGFTCPSDQTCSAGFGNPYRGHASFDDFGSAMLLVVTIVSTSNWIYYTDALIESEYSGSFLYSICPDLLTLRTVESAIFKVNQV